ncbi:hypothetical protein DFH28DRAFT_1104625 [Melampsora americana]|nr:hypothetical protein DFH28DRAFT_1104625 [Melampsora americana]
MSSWRLGIQYLYALTFIICFISIGISVTTPESLDIKILEKSDHNLEALSQQDANHLMKDPGKEIDQVDKEHGTEICAKEKDDQNLLSPVDGELNSESSISKDYMLSAYAPEFGPMTTSDPSSVPPSQHLGSNHPSDFLQGSNNNYDHSQELVHRLELGHPGAIVFINTPLYLVPAPLITPQQLNQQSHKYMEMQPTNSVQNISRKNKSTLGQSKLARSRYHHTKTRSHDMDNPVSESDVSAEPQTTDKMAGSSKQENQVINLEATPVDKDTQIEEEHKSSMAEPSSKNDYKSGEADKKHSGLDLIKDTTLNHGGTSNQVEESSIIENRYSHRLKKNFKPLNSRIEQVKEKNVDWSRENPPSSINTHTDSHLGQGTGSVLHGSPILDPWKSKLALEKHSLMESQKEAKIEQLSTRENRHKLQASDGVGSIISQDKDDWIIPKKTFKKNKIGKVNISQDSMITELTKVHHEPSSDSTNLLEASKSSSTKLQNVSKKHNKKIKSSSKSISNADKKGKARKNIDDAWDSELLKALEETSVPDERIETEHEKLIKNVRKRLQSVFVSDDNRNIDVPSSSSHPPYRSLIEDFLCVENHTPRLELKLKSQTFKTLRKAEAKSPNLYNNTYWSQIIDELLADKLTSVDQMECIRRKRAFFVQYLHRQDSEVFQEKSHMWSEEERQLATLLHYENPFELFLDSTKEEIEALNNHLILFAASEREDKLSGDLSLQSIVLRRSMMHLRIQELATPCPHGFFGKEFLEAASQQAFRASMFRQLEIVLELSAPEVSWKGLGENKLNEKYFQMLNMMAGMPELPSLPGVPNLPEYNEAELYSKANANWIVSYVPGFINNDPDLSNHVINRIKMLLVALKGKKNRPLREICTDLEGSSRPELNDELISRDEAIAATYVGISLHGIVWIKSFLKNKKIGVQGGRRPFIRWPEPLAQEEGLSGSLKMYYDLLGVKFLLRD